MCVCVCVHYLEIRRACHRRLWKHLFTVLLICGCSLYGEGELKSSGSFLWTAMQVSPGLSLFIPPTQQCDLHGLLVAGGGGAAGGAELLTLPPPLAPRAACVKKHAVFLPLLHPLPDLRSSNCVQTPPLTTLSPLSILEAYGWDPLLSSWGPCFPMGHNAAQLKLSLVSGSTHLGLLGPSHEKGRFGARILFMHTPAPL